MSISIATGMAVCHDCHKKINSDLTLSVESLIMSGKPVVYFGRRFSVITASGGLVRECATHHNLLRDPRKKSKRHDRFTVYREGLIIGQISPPSLANEATLEKVRDSFLDEIQKTEGKEGDHISKRR